MASPFPSQHDDTLASQYQSGAYGADPAFSPSQGSDYAATPATADGSYGGDYGYAATPQNTMDIDDNDDNAHNHNHNDNDDAMDINEDEEDQDSKQKEIEQYNNRTTLDEEDQDSKQKEVEQYNNRT